MFTLQLSNRSRGDNVNAPFKVDADSLQDAQRYVINQYLRREGDQCIINTPTDRTIVITKEREYRAHPFNGYRIQDVTLQGKN